jgi:hypothetical protein
MGEKCSGRAPLGLEAMAIGPANAFDKIAKLPAIPRFQISVAWTLMKNQDEYTLKVQGTDLPSIICLKTSVKYLIFVNSSFFFIVWFGGDHWKPFDLVHRHTSVTVRFSKSYKMFMICEICAIQDSGLDLWVQTIILLVIIRLKSNY